MLAYIIMGVIVIAVMTMFIPSEEYYVESEETIIMRMECDKIIDDLYNDIDTIIDDLYNDIDTIVNKDI